MKNQPKQPNFINLPFFIKSIALIIGFLIVSSFSAKPTLTQDYREKVYLHFDKPYYTAGENIWFKAYLVDANTNRPIAISEVLYVDLIDPLQNIIVSKILKIEAGGAAGDFQLPSELISGKYKVRAYTSYMRNFDNAYFFRKDIYINNLRSTALESIKTKSRRTNKEKKKVEPTIPKPDLQFFPEGGNMVIAIPNRIGFKAVGTDGKGISVSGTISDDKGINIIDFQTSKFGMGLVGFTPNQGKKRCTRGRPPTGCWGLTS